MCRRQRARRQQGQGQDWKLLPFLVARQGPNWVQLLPSRSPGATQGSFQHSHSHSHDITTRVAHLHKYTGAFPQPGGSVNEVEVVVINDTRCIDNTPRRIQDTKTEDATTRGVSIAGPGATQFQIGPRMVSTRNNSHQLQRWRSGTTACKQTHAVAIRARHANPLGLLLRLLLSRLPLLST
jgi:hypothetical protein